MKILLAPFAFILVILPFLLWAGVFSLALYGLVLAFSVHWILGVLALIVEPSPLIIGLVMFFGGVNLAEKLARVLGLL